MLKTNLISAIILSVLIHSTGFAKKVAYDPTKENKCDFGAYVTETDPKGLNVRAAADKNAKVLGTIPPAVLEVDGTYLVKPEVQVLGSKNGWIKIKGAHDNSSLIEELGKIKPRKMFKGEGWVSGKLLTVKSMASSAHDGPSKGNKVLFQDEDFDRIDSFKLLGCQGQWAYVEDKDKKSGNTYWLDGLCATQETTCQPGEKYL